MRWRRTKNAIIIIVVVVGLKSADTFAVKLLHIYKPVSVTSSRGEILGAGV